MFKEFLCLKTKQNTEMSDGRTFRQWIVLSCMKSKKRQREKLVAVVAILTKWKQVEIPVWKVSSSCTDFRNKKCHIINYLLTSTERSVFTYTVKYQTSAWLNWPRYRSVNIYIKASVWYFTVKTSLSINIVGIYKSEEDYYSQILLTI